MPNIPNFLQDQYPATDETQCIQVYIPAGIEYKWLLAGLLRLPGLVTSYQDPDSDQADGLAAVWQDAYFLTDWEGCMNIDGSQDRTLFYCAFPETVVGNAFAFTFFTNMGLVSFQSAATSNQASRYRTVTLRDGLYRAKWHTLQSSANGIVDIFLRPVAGGSDVMLWDNLDTYQGSTVINSVYTSSEFTISAGQTFDLYFLTVGKNALSSSYQCYHHMFEIFRTGDL